VAPAANETVYGLAAGIWTHDLTKAHPQLRAGTVWVNTYNIFDAARPFGGYKQLDWGREMGEEVIHEYTETESVCIGLQ
jgi:phenylacetaldehyde dehydrogenase